ncbi:SLATT domain-containing protein [Streptomyces sp. NPDC058157]|uniref:SLATT domain-containing protein n=1 Tax=Streptomyces sp. NPDC058157 TaxID=3346360 RepID=UPI0036E1ED61
MRSDSGLGAERGAGPRAGLSPGETAALLLDKIHEGNVYARARKRRFGRSAAAVKVTALVLSAASTVVLGLQNLNAWTGLALACVALVTLLAAVEPFFNWRSRSVLMEEAQYRFRRLADDLEYLMASTPTDELTFDQLAEVFTRYQTVWDDLSRTWLQHRREATRTGGA